MAIYVDDYTLVKSLVKQNVNNLSEKCTEVNIGIKI